MEQKINIKQNKKLIKTIIIFFSNIIFIIIGIWGVYVLNIDQKVLKKDKDFIFFSLQHESSPFSVDIQDFQQLHKELLNKELYEYYEIYGQPVFSEENILQDRGNAWLTDEGKYIIDAVQIGQNVCDDFGIEVQMGRGFEKTDFLYSKLKILPVLIGYEVSNSLSIGDSFYVEYLYDTYECVVIGVLSPESMIYMTNKIYLLDDCIVMPSFEVVEGSRITDGLKIHYANKVSGVIRVEKGKEKKTIKYFVSCLENTLTGNYSWHSTLLDINLRQMLNIGIYEILFIDIIACFLFNIFVRRKCKKCHN